MRRCVIVGGAPIGRPERIRAALRPDDFFIFCDSGLLHRAALGAEPDLIVADFDSTEDPHLDVETIVLPSVKDDTDTVYAVKEALRRGFEEFLLVGAAGARLDHTLANVSLLLMLDGQGKRAMLLDDWSRMEIVSREIAYIEDSYPFFSLLSIAGPAKGLTIQNAKYPLLDAEVNCEYQYAVSNEVLPGKTAEVSLREGRLLLVKVLPE